MLAPVMLPSSLRSLNFGFRSNQSLCRVTFADCLDLSLESVTRLGGLQR